MSVSYDAFAGEFLRKITEYEFVGMNCSMRKEIVDSYMKRAIAGFGSASGYDFAKNADDVNREFTVDVKDEDLYEILDIVSEGMVEQWLKPCVYKQENLENVLNTRDFTAYSPAELLKQVRTTYNDCRKSFRNMVREYSYRHGDLTELHI